ncbi:prepilin peptidase [Halobacillus fulvus]|nr:prepilin peptidase [Halobacillus fulvus]
MQLFLTIYFFLLGTILGSFYNVVGLRLPKGGLFKESRSFCPTCKRTLKAYELIPILSFVIQKGRCRTCKANISFLYPAMELLSGVMFAYSFLVFGFTSQLILALLLLSMFHIIVVTDLVYMIIPDRLLLLFFVLFLIYRFLDPLDPWWSSLAGGAIGLFLTAAVIIASRGGMGGGDMKLFGMIGFVLGWELFLLTFFLSTLIGAVISGLLLLLKVWKRKEPIPFGPFIVIASCISFFSGKMIIGWYVHTFF